MKNKKKANELGNATLPEIVKWLYVNEFGEGDGHLTPEALGKIAREMLRSPMDHSMLLRLGVRYIGASEQEAAGWDAGAPQRLWDKTFEWYALDDKVTYELARELAIARCKEEGWWYPPELEESSRPTPKTVSAEVAANCRARNHMGKRFVVYDLAVSYAKSKNSNGNAKLSRRVVARYTGLADKTSRHYIRWLVAQGWLELVKIAKVGGSRKKQQAEYRVVEHAEWVEKHGTGHCLVVV
jgi:hypothetical protein